MMNQWIGMDVMGREVKPNEHRFLVTCNDFEHGVGRVPRDQKEFDEWTVLIWEAAKKQIDFMKVFDDDKKGLEEGRGQEENLKIHRYSVRVELKQIVWWITVRAADESEAAIIAENQFLREIEGQTEARATLVRQQEKFI